MEDRIAFYKLERIEDGKSYIGAILVTDDLGTPEEFRVTYPVKPTALQRQLYGESLEPHIGINLCGHPLIKSIDTDVEIIVLNDNRFLSLSEQLEVPVAFVERAGERLEISTQQAHHDDAPSEIASRSGRFQPVHVQFDVRCDEDEIILGYELLKEYFDSIDLIEPFERISGALDALRQHDERFN